MKKKKIALLVGRFQPFHKGHLFLIKKSLAESEKIVIGIGSANIHDDKNPLDYETREKIIKSVFYKEKILDKLAKIVPLDDYFDDEKWRSNLSKKVGRFDIVVGNNEWVNRILESKGHKISRYGYFKRYLYEGERIRNLMAEKKKWQDRVPKYLVNFLKYAMIDIRPFRQVVLGGTFDNFHIGHIKLLEKAFEVGEKVTIGIATEKLYSKKILSGGIEPFDIRKKHVSDFLIKKKWKKRAELVSIDDIYGPTLKEKNIDALVVSKATFSNANLINEKRKKLGLPSIRIVVVADVLAQDKLLVTSKRIRMGEINRQGIVFKMAFEKGELILPESLRETLRKPLGEVVKNTKDLLKSIKAKKPHMTISVGDIISSSLEENGFYPGVKIIDFKSRRKDLVNKDFKGKKVTNNPGSVSKEAVEEIDRVINVYLKSKKRQSVIIDGEEDLLALPSILLAPPGSVVLYGHFGLGIILVQVNLDTKDRIFNIVRKFS